MAEKPDNQKPKKVTFVTELLWKPVNNAMATTPPRQATASGKSKSGTKSCLKKNTFCKQTEPTREGSSAHLYSSRAENTSVLSETCGNSEASVAHTVNSQSQDIESSFSRSNSWTTQIVNEIKVSVYF